MAGFLNIYFEFNIDFQKFLRKKLFFFFSFVHLFYYLAAEKGKLGLKNGLLFIFLPFPLYSEFTFLSPPLSLPSSLSLSFPFLCQAIFKDTSNFGI